MAASAAPAPDGEPTFDGDRLADVVPLHSRREPGPPAEASVRPTRRLRPWPSETRAGELMARGRRFLRRSTGDETDQR